MFFLSLDVSIDFGHHRFADREGAITFLSGKGATFPERSRNPTGRVRFEVPNELRKCFVLPQLRQNMDVIGSAINDQRDSVFVANRSPEILMEPRANCWRQPRLTAFRGKDNVVQEIAIGGTHRKLRFPSPLFRGLIVSNHIPGVPLRSTPGFRSGAPFRRSNEVGVCYPTSRAIGNVHAPERRRRDGLKPGVQRSGTPGSDRIRQGQTPGRGDGTNGSRGASHSARPK
jgi:hypothetical protein